MKILIVKTSALGDIIQSFIVLDYLYAKFDNDKNNINLQIDWVVGKEGIDLVRAHPLVNRAIEFDSKKFKKFDLRLKYLRKFKAALRKEKYDIVFDLQGNIKSGIITYLSLSKNKVGFAFHSVAEWPNILFTNLRFNCDKNKNISGQYLQILKKYFKVDSDFKYNPSLLKISVDQKAELDSIAKDVKGIKIVVCPFSKWKSKELDMDILLRFLKKIAKKRAVHFLFAWHGEREEFIAQKLSSSLPLNSTVLPKMKLPMLQNFMEKCGFVISMDSAPLHLAAMARCKTFSFFGPSSSKVYKPQGPKHISIQGSCYSNGYDSEKRCKHLRRCQYRSCINNFDEDKASELFLSQLFQ